MTIIELNEQEIKHLLNGEEIDKTILAYTPPLIIRRLPIFEEKKIEKIYTINDLKYIPTIIKDCGCTLHCSKKEGNCELSNTPSHYNHNGGWNIEGIETKQWISYKCINCGYEWSLHKLLRRLRDVLQKEKTSGFIACELIKRRLKEILKDEL